MNKPRRPTLGSGFSVAWKFNLRNSRGKRFFPGANRIMLRDFQTALKHQKDSIFNSLVLLYDQKYEYKNGEVYVLNNKIYLGKRKLHNVGDMASYLYSNSIDPRFFAEVLYFIGIHAKTLNSIIEKIQLLNLGRKNIEKAMAQKKIDQREIGSHFQSFSRQSVPKKIEILKSLGVLILKKGDILSEGPYPNETQIPFLSTFHTQ